MPKLITKIRQRLLAAGVAAAHVKDALTIIKGDVRYIELGHDGRWLLRLLAGDLVDDIVDDFSEEECGGPDGEPEPEGWARWFETPLAATEPFDALVHSGWEFGVYFDRDDATLAADLDDLPAAGVRH